MLTVERLSVSEHFVLILLYADLCVAPLLLWKMNYFFFFMVLCLMLKSLMYFCCLGSFRANLLQKLHEIFLLLVSASGYCKSHILQEQVCSCTFLAPVLLLFVQYLILFIFAPCLLYLTYNCIEYQFF